ncbi:zinc finger protein 91 [Strongylocentrotus purpuratus]|uniref:C2H2-type domain-containing protein n=1 Tax=Strongylocentrotus purpuratus TaxID=7668 RepID=A0A7M7PFC9_STRPU|nr:zinc finger protein 91 [Strongylocentrotus purpuratus]
MDRPLKQEPLFEGEGGETGDTGGLSFSLIPIRVKKEDNTFHSDNTVARPSIKPTPETLWLATSGGATSSHNLQAPEREDDEPDERSSDEGIGRSPATYENAMQSHSEEEAGSSSGSAQDTRKGSLLDTQAKPIFFCDVCSMAFTEENHLARHMQKHTFICHFCGKQFSSDSELLQHEDVHKKGQEHCCKECDIIFESKAALEDHYGDHMYACSLCPKTFTNHIALLNHENGHQDPKLSCNGCGKSFNRLSNLKVHKQKHCRRGSQVSRNLRANKGPRGSVSPRSAKETPIQENGEDNGTQNCAEDDGSREQDDMAVPVKNAVAPKLGRDLYFHCSDCPKAFSNKDDFAKHKLNHQGNNGTMTNGTTRSEAHVGLETSTYGDGFECKDCRTTYPSLGALQNHLLKHIYPCHLCDSSFTNLRLFKRHVNSHNLIYPCPQCEREFKKRYYLQVHVARVHRPSERDGAGKSGISSTETVLKDTNEPQSPVQPSSCESPLKEDIAMKRSLRLKCRICGKSYARKSDLTKHMNHGKHNRPRLQTSSGLKVETPSRQQQSTSTGHAKSPPSLSATFKGIIRPKTISIQSKPIMDGNSGTQGNDRSVQDSKMREPATSEFECKICSKIFAQKRYLTDHTKRQHQEKNNETKVEVLEKSKSVVFQCRRCPKRFHRKSDLTMHMKRGKHPAISKKGKRVIKDSETGGLPKISSRKETLNSPSSSSDLSCKICSKTFSSQYRLSVHRTLEKHDDSISVRQCSICSKIFKQKRYLADHIRLYHPELRINIKAKGTKKLDGSEIQSKGKSNISMHLKDGKQGEVNQQGKDAVVGLELGGLPKNFKCSECPKVYNSKLYFQRHITLKHPGSRMTDMLKKSQGTKFHCRKCPKTFRRKSDLTMHMKRGKHQATLQKGKGAIRKFEIGNDGSVRDNKVREPPTTEFRCKFCSKIFAQKRYLTDHMKRKHQEKNNGTKVEVLEKSKSMVFQCRKCPKRFRRKSDLAMHMTRGKHPAISQRYKRVGQSSDLRCNICSKTFSSQYRFSVHMALGKHGGISVTQCSICSTIFKQKRYLTDHMRRSHPGIRSNITKAKGKSNISMHLKHGKHGKVLQQEKTEVVGSELGGLPKNFKCSLCPKVYGTRRHLQRHRSKIHPEMVRKLQGTKFHCTKCPKTFCRSSDFSKHMSSGKHEKGEDMNQNQKRQVKYEPIEAPVISTESTFVCTKCPKEFARKCDLKVHMDRSKHVKTKEVRIESGSSNLSESLAHKCSLCTNSYSNRSSLLRHIKGKHPVHQCQICLKSFSCKRYLTAHIKCRHPELLSQKSNGKGSSVECLICFKSFSRKYTLTQHMKKCHSRDAHLRVYQSKSICKETPTVGLTNHQCPQCPKAFPTAFGLTMHIKLGKHISVKNQSRNTFGNTRVRGPKDTFYQCGKCPRVFSKQSDLSLHMKRGKHPIKESAHTYLRCPKCPRTFSRKEYLLQHMKKGEHINQNQIIKDTPKMDTTKQEGSSGSKRFMCSKCTMSYTRKNHLQNHIRSKHPQSESQEAEVSSQQTRAVVSGESNGLLPDGKEVRMAASSSEKGGSSQMEQEEAVVFSQSARTVVSEKSNGLLPDGKEVGKTAAFSSEIASSSQMEQEEVVVQPARTVSEKSNGLLPDGKGVGKPASSPAKGSSSKMAWKCPECEKIFASRPELNRHQDTHVFMCNYCNRFYTTHKSLEEHACAQKKRASSPSPVASNVPKPKNPEVVHKCELCMKSFPSNADLETHKEQHTLNEFKDDATTSSASVMPSKKTTVIPDHFLTCRFCDKVFTSLELVHNHERSHLSSM